MNTEMIIEADRVFDGVVDDQVVVAERKPRPHRHKVSVLQRARTFPFKQKYIHKNQRRKHIKSVSLKFVQSLRTSKLKH